MARTQAKRAATSPTGWLPGFEPDDYQNSNAIQAVLTFPPMMPSPVALVTAAVVNASLCAVGTGTAKQRQVMEVIYADATEAFAIPDEEPANEALIEIAPPDLAAQKVWPKFDPKRYAPGASVNARIDQNLAAIELMLKLRSDKDAVTDDDRHQMLAYSGWGGAARLFEDLPGNSLAPKREHLINLVSEDEFASARSSTTSAYYTDPVVIDAMWKIVRTLGFTGGRVIEPTAGTGLFVANMPADLALNSEITAVELDKISAELLGLVFGGLGVQVHGSAIEKAPVPHGFYDLAISNVPFGEHKSLETRKVGYSEFSIHNYCIGKSIDMVRPGGLVVVITSAYTMDSSTRSHRDWINAHAEMLGAIRLPESAFKKSAGTEVVTDIIVFKKRAAPKFNASHSWKALAQASEGMLLPGQDLTIYDSHARRNFDRDRSVNEWYVANPHMVLGDMVLDKARYGRDILKTVFKGDEQAFEKRLQEAVQCMPSGVYEALKHEDEPQQSLGLQSVRATAKVKPGAFVLHGDRICMGEDEWKWIDVDDAFKGKARERVIGLIGIKEVARKLIQSQVSSDDDADFKGHQLQLNIRYDAFVAKYGNVADTANMRVFRSDPDCPLVLSLEHYDEESETYKKADIFSRRTAGKKTPPEHVDSIKDAMLVSLGLYGRLHIGDMAMRMQIASREVMRQMRDDGLAYVDPDDGKWKSADEYLSGNIRQKIHSAAAAGTKYSANVGALTSVLPKDLGPAQVEVRLGAPWVPIDVVEKFTAELVNLRSAERQRLQVSYSAESATWSIVATQGGGREFLGDSTLNNQKWGTLKRCAIDLIEAALNQVPPKITFTVDGKSVVDRSATLAAREKYEAIRQEFKTWAYREDARRDRLLRIYNDEFNQIVERKFDGAHMVLYGMSLVITPYKHQLDAIWRIVSGGNTLLAHVVGAGKTFTMIASAMEMRRIGKANKPLMVVPNHLLAQFVGDCVRFYPTAKVLMASKDDLQGDKRREFCARIATGDWDAVVMTHATFERLPTSPKATKAFVDELLDQARSSLRMAEESNAKRTVKQCEKILKTLEAKVERALNESSKDDMVYFDELGVDHLMIDEAQIVKNLLRISKMPSIAGLPNVASNRAFDAWIKTSLIMQAKGGKEEGITFATATPITNSVSEAFTMQKFLQPYTLKRMGLYEFDAWSSTFGEAITGMEVSPDGGGYRLSTRFSRFVNVPDLMAIFRMVADIKTRSMVRLPTPEIAGGKPMVVLSPPSQEMLDYTEELVERAGEIRAGRVKPDQDNMLAITNCGRKAALDMRLIDPTLPFDPQGKIGKAVENIMRIWRETADKRGTQLVFCDLSTPLTTGFSVYTDLRQRLVDAGMPAQEIAFIHDYDTDMAKDRLFRQVRSGRVRVLLGSTQKLGIGTNVQKRLKAVHQLDAPWRPSDVEQRDGRALRAGNIWEDIYLLRYVTENSFDAYIWNLLETKARFIEQVMTASNALRTVEDLSMGALSYAEIKAIASGNPLVLEKATVDAEVMKYSMLRNSWEQDRWEFGRKARSNVEVIQVLEATIEAVELDAKAVSQEMATALQFVPAGKLSMAVEGATSLQAKIGAKIQEVSRLTTMIGDSLVGVLGGMQVILGRYDGVNVSLRSQHDERVNYAVRRNGVSIYDTFGTGKLVTNLIESLVGEPAIRRERIERMRLECERIQISLAQPYEHEEKFKELVLRQRAIEAELDLDKDEAGTVGATEAVTT